MSVFDDIIDFVTPDFPDKVLAANLSPTNDSGVEGFAYFVLDDNRLTVDMEATGLEPNQIHAQHIHGLPGNLPSQLPTSAQDTDHDGYVEDPEGEPLTGPVLLALTTSDTVSQVEVSNDFPTADAQGNLDFHQTYTFNTNDPEDAAILNALEAQFDDRVVQIHGVTVPQGAGAGTPHEVNGNGGYKPELPVANALIQELPRETPTDLLETAQHHFDWDWV
jgi:hypothetical protein